MAVEVVEFPPDGAGGRLTSLYRQRSGVLSGRTLRANPPLGDPMEPLSFDSSDVGLTEATVSKLYSKMRISAVGECTRTQITRRVMAPGLGFDDLDYSFNIGYSGAAQGHIIICDVVTSTIRRVGEGHDETFGPGDLFVISRPNLPYPSHTLRH